MFVSIVSTKVPFKGTNKEYIGAEATALAGAVAKALQKCCAQLKTQLVKKQEAKDAMNRSKVS